MNEPVHEPVCWILLINAPVHEQIRSIPGSWTNQILWSNIHMHYMMSQNLIKKSQDHCIWVGICISISRIKI